ncbi:MAG: helix-turn-helix domain-containing protein [Tetragenococcus koreensis]|nr:helix-turn-helix domain-containing protein [Tetragenococcus koreensis]
MSRQKYDDAIETGKRIRLARIEKGLSMEQLGERLTPPASKGAVSNWENGYNLPNNVRLMQLCDVLGVSTIYLLSGKYMIRDIHMMPEIEKNRTVDSIRENIKYSNEKIDKRYTLALKNIDITEFTTSEKAFLAQINSFISNYSDIENEEFINAFVAIFTQLNRMYDDYSDKQLTNAEK